MLRRTQCSRPRTRT